MQQPTDKLFTLEQVKKDKDHDYALAKYVDGIPMYRRSMTNDEIAQAATEEWMEVLSQLWVAFGKPVDADQMMIYHKSLSCVPLGLLELAILRTIRNYNYSNVPPVASVWAAIRAELKNPYDIDQAIEQWCDSLWTNATYYFNPVDVAVEME